MQIEEEFEVEIPDEVASNMKTVKDIVDILKQTNSKEVSLRRLYIL